MDKQKEAHFPQMLIAAERGDYDTYFQVAKKGMQDMAKDFITLAETYGEVDLPLTVAAMRAAADALRASMPESGRTLADFLNESCYVRAEEVE